MKNSAKIVRREHRVAALATRGALVALLSVAGLGACADSTKDRLKTIQLGEECSLDSECVDDLVCIFARCHRACNEDTDCKDSPNQRCVLGEKGHNVCQLEDEARCERNRDCRPSFQVCAVDGKCRDECEEKSDCVGDQVCTPSGQCASSDPARDTLGPSGDLIPTAAGGTPAAGGSGGATSTDASTGGTSSGGAETGGKASGGAETGGSASGGADNGGTGPDAGVDGGSDGFVETGDVETWKNNIYQDAILAGSTASIYLPEDDVDWFKVVAPDGGGAYVLEIAAEHQTGARSFFQLHDGADRNPIGTAIKAGGSATSRAFLTVGPGTTTYVKFQPDLANTGDHRIDVTFSLTAENDAFEPNDTPQTAKRIQLDTEVRAQCLRKYVTSTDQIADDVYLVALQQGPATLHVTSPTSSDLRFALMGDGTSDRQIGQVKTTAPVTIPFTVQTAGSDRYIRVFPNSTNEFVALATPTEPAHMTAQYVFTVTQP